MKFSVLFSDSSGNCTYIEAGDTRILIDCGRSRKQINDALAHFGTDLSQIDAIFVTHEHSDHVCGLRVIEKQYKTPVFGTEGTYVALRGRETGDVVDEWNFTIMDAGCDLELGPLTIHSFPIPHNASDPVGYTISEGDKKLGYVADLGETPQVVRYNLQSCSALILEANHDPVLQRNSNRAESLISRNLSRDGHLSNEQSAGLLTAVACDCLRYVVPVHVSHECNTPDLVVYTLQKAIDCVAKNIRLFPPEYPSPMVEL